MESLEGNQGQSEEHPRGSHTVGIGLALVELGPIKFFETLRALRENYSGMPMQTIFDDLSSRGIIHDGRHFRNMMIGYLDDKDEWDEILGTMERNYGN